MGPTRFQNLYNFAWTSEAPHIKIMQPLPAPVAAPTSPPAPPKQ
jgi:hypothetical protein